MNVQKINLSHIFKVFKRKNVICDAVIVSVSNFDCELNATGCHFHSDDVNAGCKWVGN